MRIRRLNESINNVGEFISNFNDSVEEGIINWISDISVGTKLKDYMNIGDYIQPSKVKEVIKSKNFKFYGKYIETMERIEKLDKEKLQLEEKSEQLYNQSADEILYQFQMDLLDKDFKSFYEFFIVSNMVDHGDEINGKVYTLEELLSDDIHPKILDEYFDDIEMKIDTIKYNL